MYFLISITVTYRGGSRQRVSGSRPKQIQRWAVSRRGSGNFQHYYISVVFGS